MFNYDWRCPACEAVNKKNDCHCVKCSCPAETDADTVERSRDPEVHAYKKAESYLSRGLSRFSLIPFVLIILVMSSHYINAILLMLLLGSIIFFKYSDIVGILKSNRWAIQVYTLWIIVNSIIPISVFFVINLEILVFILIVLAAFAQPVFYLYLFKSERGKLFVKEYQEIKFPIV